MRHVHLQNCTWVSVSWATNRVINTPFFFSASPATERMAEKALQSLRTETKPEKTTCEAGSMGRLPSAFDGPPDVPFAEYVKSAHVDRLAPGAH